MAGSGAGKPCRELEPVVGIEPTTYGLRIRTIQGRICGNMRFYWGFSTVHAKGPVSSPRQSVPNCPKNTPGNDPLNRSTGFSPFGMYSRVSTGVPTHPHRASPGLALPGHMGCLSPGLAACEDTGVLDAGLGFVHG